MDTIKTAFVVALLLAVLYGVYVVLNKDQALPPPEVTEMMDDLGGDDLLAPPDIDMGGGGDVGGGVSVSVPPDSAPATGDASVFVPPSENSRVVVRVEPPEGDAVPTLPESPSAVAGVRPPRADQFSTESFVPPDSSSVYSGNAIRAPQSNSDAVDTSPPPQSTIGQQYDPDKTYSFENATDVAATPSGPRVRASELFEPNGTTTPAADAISSTAPSTAGTNPVNATRVVPPSVDDAIAVAKQQIAGSKYTAALTSLTATYLQGELTENDRRKLQDMLDPLAAKVIYSREHLLESAYTTRGGETLSQVATQYQVPVQLLQNINGIKDPNVILAGTPLKVVRGPFEADVDLLRGELTLFVQDMYAGRFPIAVGEDPRPVPGGYAIADKQEGREYFTPDGRTIPAGDPQNPYGLVWMDLGTNRLCIHGSSATDAASRHGCISLSPRDARDVFSILSVGSHVRIY